MSDTRCVFCGKRPEEPAEAKVMRLDKLYECYCVTLAKYRARGAANESQAYGNDCINGNCEV